MNNEIEEIKPAPSPLSTALAALGAVAVMAYLGAIAAVVLDVMP